MNPLLAAKLATALGASLATDTAEAILRELQAAYWQGAVEEREACAKLVEQLGIEGYGTLAIAAAIRQRGRA